jgi:hypothetical protein
LEARPRSPLRLRASIITGNELPIPKFLSKIVSRPGLTIGNEHAKADGLAEQE